MSKMFLGVNLVGGFGLFGLLSGMNEAPIKIILVFGGALAMCHVFSVMYKRYFFDYTLEINTL